jgi:tetratricopeptide (TPR) repeat protein
LISEIAIYVRRDREHASEKEKLDIQALYYSTITREFEKVLETYKLWAEAYPHDYVPLVNLSNQYAVTGQMEEAIAASQQALRLNPDQAISYAGLGAAYQRASRFSEAKTICEKAVTEKLDSWTTHRVLYMIAFVEGDEPSMQKEVDWFKGKPTESVGTYYQAKAALSLGELRASPGIANTF